MITKRSLIIGVCWPTAGLDGNEDKHSKLRWRYYPLWNCHCILTIDTIGPHMKYYISKWEECLKWRLCLVHFVLLLLLIDTIQSSSRGTLIGSSLSFITLSMYHCIHTLIYTLLIDLFFQHSHLYTDSYQSKQILCCNS